MVLPHNGSLDYLSSPPDSAVKGSQAQYARYKVPQEMGIHVSFQRDLIGLGDTTIRLGWAEDITHNLLGGMDLGGNARQRHMGVAIEQPLAKGLNVLFGWNQYKIGGLKNSIHRLTSAAYSATYNPFTAGGAVANASFLSNSSTTKLNTNSVFVMGLEYEIAI